MATENFHPRVKRISGEIIEIGAGRDSGEESVRSFVVLRGWSGELIKIHNVVVGDAQDNEFRAGNEVSLYVRPLFKRLGSARRNYIAAIESARGYAFHAPRFTPIVVGMFAMGLLSPVVAALFLGGLGYALGGTGGGLLVSFMPLLLMWSYALALLLAKLDINSAIRRLRKNQRQAELSGVIPSYVNM